MTGRASWNSRSGFNRAGRASVRLARAGFGSAASARTSETPRALRPFDAASAEMATRGRGDAREHANCCAEVVRTRDTRRTRHRIPPRPSRPPRSTRALFDKSRATTRRLRAGTKRRAGSAPRLTSPRPRLVPPPLLSSRCCAASRVPARMFPGIPRRAATPRATWWRAEPLPRSARSLEATAHPRCPPLWTASAATTSPANPTTPRIPPPAPTARTRSPARSDASFDAYAAIDPSTQPTSSSSPSLSASVAEA